MTTFDRFLMLFFLVLITALIIFYGEAIINSIDDQDARFSMACGYVVGNE